MDPISGWDLLESVRLKSHADTDANLRHTDLETMVWGIQLDKCVKLPFQSPIKEISNRVLYSFPVPEHATFF
jgi:hypothetical protein